jgi:hypothetical protein
MMPPTTASITPTINIGLSYGQLAAFARAPIMTTIIPANSVFPAAVEKNGRIVFQFYSMAKKLVPAAHPLTRF